MKGAFSSYPQVETAPFISKIEAVMSDLPKQEARAAKFMLLNSRDLGFQTGASIANRAGVSEVTVSRLLHRLGYRGMSDLKREIQEEQQAGQMGLYPHKSAIEDYGPLKSVLDAEIKVLITVFEQFHTPIWQQLVAEVSEAECVFVTGFQTALMAKDLRLYVESARTGGSPLDIAKWVAEIWQRADSEMPDSDCTRIFELICGPRRGSL